MLQQLERCVPAVVPLQRLEGFSTAFLHHAAELTGLWTTHGGDQLPETEINLQVTAYLTPIKGRLNGREEHVG